MTDVGTLGTSTQSQRTDPASCQDFTSVEAATENGEEARKNINNIRGIGTPWGKGRGP